MRGMGGQKGRTSISQPRENSHGFDETTQGHCDGSRTAFIVAGLCELLTQHLPSVFSAEERHPVCSWGRDTEF